ncbi:MAG: hypothetical protein IJE68_05325 [Clostridia bacterium]|nr:hypothetical protein [Clostridia bacterium]
MGNESGKSTVILLIMTILIIIGAVTIINYAKEMMMETNVQDLRTDMLLIQAEAKKGLEQVCFETVNLDASKEDDLTKINEAKQQNLDGTILSNSPEKVQNSVKDIPDVVFDESCYYLDEATLTEMGIKNIDEEENGYIIVKYNFSNADVEVINTKGYNGKYTLTQIISTNTEGQS